MLYTGRSLVYSEDEIAPKDKPRRQYKANLELPITYQSGVNPCKSMSIQSQSADRGQSWSIWSIINADEQQLKVSGNSNTNCNEIDTALAAHCHALAKVMPILDIWRTIVSLIYWTSFYAGCSLVYSEDALDHTRRSNSHPSACLFSGLQCQSRPSPVTTNSPIFQSLAKPCQSSADFVPIRRQIFHPSKNTYLPITSNPGQSMPILVNPMPILDIRKTNVHLTYWTSFYTGC